jgi:hypothetical protein
MCGMMGIVEARRKRMAHDKKIWRLCQAINGFDDLPYKAHNFLCDAAGK